MTQSDSESSDEDVGQANNNMDCDPTFAGACSSSEPHLLTQGDPNDIIHDMNLSKKPAELLDSRLKDWNLLCQDIKLYFYCEYHEEFKDFFFLEDGVMFCNDVYSNVEVLGHEYNSDQWRLFTDSSKVRLKVVLLHNGNRLPSVPLTHATNLKESYENMKLLLGKIMNLSVSYVVISRLWHCYLECNSNTQITAVSCAIGTPRTRRITM